MYIVVVIIICVHKLKLANNYYSLNPLVCCLIASVFSEVSNALDNGGSGSRTTLLSSLLHSCTTKITCNVTSINSATLSVNKNGIKGPVL